MPELPEIETIKLELEKLIKHKIIKSVEIRLAKQVKNPKPEFLRLVGEARVIGIKRRAKVLIIDLSNGYHLVFHLKLTGQLIYKGYKRGKKEKGYKKGEVLAGAGLLPNKYSHLIFNFADGSRLFFNDRRQFGWVKLVDDGGLEKITGEFGPEPFEMRDFRAFRELFKNKKQAIKPLLMDQEFLAGLGNIYAQEVCFCAGILPTRKANQITESELKKLFNCLHKILKLAINKKGTSADAYLDVFGRQGSMGSYLKVYGRAGEKCQRCGTKLKLIRQHQRATVYCEKCQK